MYGSLQANTYRGSDILSATPGRLLIITYDGLITAMTRLRLAIGAGNEDLVHSSAELSRALLGELLVTLDREAGGEIATDLARLYTFVFGELNALALSRDVPRLDRNIALIREIRDAFAQIASPPARAAS
jgi:flagellar protein FliS